MRFRTEKRTGSVGVHHKTVNKDADIDCQSLRIIHSRGLFAAPLAEKS